jgi:hypothetical protein
MKIQKLAIAAVVSTAFIFLLDYVWYMVLMKDFFTPMPNQKAQPDFMWLILGILIYSFAFVYLYTKTAGNGSMVNEGVKFGLWASLLAWVSMGFIWYSLLDGASMSEMMVDTVYRIVQMVILGIIVAYLTGVPGGMRGKGADGGDG